jgi:YidC/Oxa1 family membrane protein insertase
MFQAAAWLIDTFYSWVHNHAIAIAMVALAIMLLLTPLTIKSTKGMLEMQRLQPEMKKLQVQHKGDRQKLNEEMMKLYQEHKVNPLASCLPLLAQMPVFIIMFRVLRGLTSRVNGTFDPKYIDEGSELFAALKGKTQMLSFGLDLSVSPADAMSADFVKGIWYALLIVALGGLFFVQQRMVASRATSPTMSPTQAKIMQYLPVAFALFQVFLPTSLVFYYMTQAIVRIIQQWYITRRFYGEDGLGSQAQAASAKARDIGKDDAKSSKQKNEQSQAPAPIQSKRVTPGKNKPTPSGGRPSRPVPPSKRNK